MTFLWEIVMAGNVCKGCKYDLTDRVVTDREEFNIILDHCCVCKRAKLEEYQDEFLDLYKPIKE